MSELLEKHDFNPNENLRFYSQRLTDDSSRLFKHVGSSHFEVIFSTKISRGILILESLAFGESLKPHRLQQGRAP